MLKTTICSRFDELPRHFAKLLNDAEGVNFFLGGSWFENFSCNTVEPTARIRIYAVEDDEEDAQARALLFMRSPAGQKGSFFERSSPGPRTLASMTGHQSVFFAPLVMDSDQQFDGVISTLIEAVCSDKHSWTMIDLNFLDSESHVYASLSKALADCGMVVRRYVYRANLYENIAGMSFPEFVASRSSMVRKTIQRKARKLEKTGQLRFHVEYGDSGIDSAILAYEQVLAHSWKEPEPFPRHAAGLIRAAAASGVLRLGLLHLGERPVAVQLWIVSGGKATIYKLHYDTEYRQQSVGGILTLRMFEHVIDVDHVDEVNFGVGNEPAKRDWLADERPICGLVAFNPRTFGGLWALIRFSTKDTIQRVKERLKPVLRTLLQKLAPSIGDK
jgi:hypothetical protein